MHYYKFIKFQFQVLIFFFKIISSKRLTFFIKRIIIFFFFFSFATFSYSQRDTAFWFAVPQIAHSHGGVIAPVRAVFRIATYDNGATVTLSVPANNGVLPITKIIPPNSLDSIDISADIQNALNNPLENYPYDQVMNKGVLIRSTSLVNIYYDFGYWKNPEIFVLKGYSALGTDFVIPSQTRFANATDASISPPARFSFDIVATKNNTVVNITPTKNLIGHVAGTMFQIHLDSGQTYSAGAASVLGADHPVGTAVSSNFPIAITIKDESLVTTGWDVIGDQIVPINYVGNKYVLVKGDAGSNEYVYITATKNQTKLWINNTLITTLNPGQTYEHPMTNSVDFVQTDYPVYAYQLSGVDVEAASALIPAMGCSGSTQVAIYRSGVTMNATLDLILITKKGAENKFKLTTSGTTVALNGISFSNVPSTTDLVYAFYKVPVGIILPDKSYILNNDSLFTLGILGANGVNGGASLGYISNIGSNSIVSSISRFSTCSFWLSTEQPPLSSLYHYTWDFAPNKDTFAVQVPANITKVKVIINKVGGCTDSVITNINRVAPPSITDKWVCKGDSALFDATNAIAIYKWFNGSTSSSIKVKDPGIVSVDIAVNDSSCPMHLSANLNNFLPINPSAGKDTTICKGSSIQLTATPIGAKDYKWSYGNNLSANTRIISVTPVDSLTIFHLTVTDTNSCVDSAKVNVLTHSFYPPQIDDVSVCSNVPADVTLKIKNPIATYTYNWYDSFQNGTLISQGNQMHISNVAKGYIYYIETIDPAKICPTPPREKVEITMNTKPTADFNWNPTIITQGSPVQFINQTSNASGFDWSFGKNQSSSPLKDPNYVYMDQGYFDVSLVAYQTFSNVICYDTVVKNLFVKPKLFVWIPASFTPNNDGKNDILYVRGPVKTMNFIVYNQWGFKVFESNDPTQGWDGKYKGVEQPEGNYIWTLDVTTFDELSEKKQGEILLLR